MVLLYVDIYTFCVPMSHDEATDEEILKLLADNNPKSILLMYERYHEVILKRLKAIVGHAQDAEDITQELFLSIWDKRSTLKLITPMKGYLLAAAHNRAVNFLRQKARRKVVPVDIASVFMRDRLIDYQVESRRSIERTMKLAIQMLPHRTRIVYILSRNLKMSNQEIAIQLNISIKAVEKHITKALKLLRQFLRLSLMVIYCFFES